MPKRTSKKKASKGSRSTGKPSPAERRTKAALREILDELVDHVREVTRMRDAHPQQLDYAQERLEWLADEVWRLAVEEDRPL